MLAQHVRNHFKAVIGIDLGVYHSGCCYALVSEVENGNEENWPVNFVYLGEAPQTKAATKLLLQANDPFTVIAFGAEVDLDMYEDDCLLFQKLQLFRGNIPRFLSDDAGKGEAPTNVVVQRCLECLRDRALKAIERERGLHLNITDVLWVVTVPACWKLQHRHFIMNCATKVGFCHSENSFRIALEPECATLDVNAISPFLTLSVRFLVVDCGSGAVDCTSVEFVGTGTSPARMKIITKPISQETGGCQVDKNFVSFLQQVVGHIHFNQGSFALSDILETWKRLKHSLNSRKLSSNQNFVFSATALSEIQDYTRHQFGQDVENFNKSMESNGVHLSTRRGFDLVMPWSLILSFFEPVITSIVKLIVQQVAAAGKLDYVILTGGFSNCDLLQNRVREALETLEPKLIIARSPSINTVCGAVRCGLMTDPSPPCDCDALRHEIQDLRERIEIAETNHAAQIQDLEESNIKLLIAKDAEIGDLKLKISEAEENSKEIQEKSARMQALTSKLERASEQLKTQNERQKDNLRLRQIELHESRCQLKDLQNRNSYLDMESQHLQKELTVIRAEFSNSEHCEDILQQKGNLCQDQVQEKQKRVSWLASKLETVKLNIAEFRQTICDQRNSIAHLQDQLAREEKRIDEVKVLLE